MSEWDDYQDQQKIEHAFRQLQQFDPYITTDQRRKNRIANLWQQACYAGWDTDRAVNYATNQYVKDHEILKILNGSYGGGGSKYAKPNGLGPNEHHPFRHLGGYPGDIDVDEIGHWQDELLKRKASGYYGS